MSIRTILGLSVPLLLAAAPARAEGVFPPHFKTLKPYEVVEQIAAQREILVLSEEQLVKLEDLSTTLRAEKHRFIHRGGRPHTTEHVPMVSRKTAYSKALALLTPDQQGRMEALFPAAVAPKAAPRRPIVPRGKP